MPVNEIEAEVSIGTEIPDLEHTDEFQNQEILPPYTTTDDDPSISFGKPQTLLQLAKNRDNLTLKHHHVICLVVINCVKPLHC